MDGQVKCSQCGSRVHPEDAEYFYGFGKWECNACVEAALDEEGVDVDEFPTPDELGLNVVKSNQRREKAQNEGSFSEKSSGDMTAGEIAPCRTKNGVQTWKIRCPDCMNISWLDNWIDGGCDWCDFNPEKIVLKFESQSSKKNGDEE